MRLLPRRRARQDPNHPNRPDPQAVLCPRLAPRDALREAVSSIAARPARSMLTMAGTILGCAAFIAIIGLTTTASGQISAKFNELEATTVTVTDIASQEGAALTGEGGYEFPREVGPIMRKLNGVVDGGVYFKCQMSSGEVMGQIGIGIRPQIDMGEAGGPGLTVYGAEPGTLVAALTEVVSGRGLDEFDMATDQNVAVLGYAAAAQLAIASVATGPTVFIGNDPYSVVGVLGEESAIPELGTAVIIPAPVALERYGNPSPMEPARALIRTDLGAAQLIARQAPLALRPDDPKALASTPPTDWSMVTDDVNTSVNGLLLALAGIALIIGCIAIANTTLVAVMERTGEIGLRQALGAKPAHITVQFLIESIVLGGLGGLAGAAVGVAAVLAGAVIMEWSPVLDPMLSLAAPGIGIVVGALAGLYPAWRASRIPPAAALQHA